MLTHANIGCGSASSMDAKEPIPAETLQIRLGHAMSCLQDQAQILYGMGNRVLGSQPEPVCATNAIEQDPNLSRQISQLHEITQDISRYVQRLNSVL